MFNWETMKDIVLELQKKNYKEFLKAIISIEKQIDDEKLLEIVFQNYIAREHSEILNDEIDDCIQKGFEELYERGKINEFWKSWNNIFWGF